MKRAAEDFFSGIIFFLISGTLHACPYCHTPTGVKVREGILDGSFLFHLLAVSSPFLILGILFLFFHQDSK